MVQQHFKGRSLAGFQGALGAGVNFGFQTATAERADDASVLEKKRLGADALRAGAFDAGNQSQGKRLVLRQRGGELFIKARHGN